jgi:DNA segregation ATPase FtsK/SpoIIIE-like protein
MHNNKQIHGIDVMFEDAAKHVVENKYAVKRFIVASAFSLIMRRLDISYERASKIADQLEATGIVGPQKEGIGRDVLVKSIDELDWLISKCLSSYVWTPTEEKYKK